MLGHIEAAWKPIQTYQYKDESSGFPTGSYIGDKATNLAGTVNGVKQAVSDTVKYLYDKGNFVKINHSLSVSYKCPECGADSTKNIKSCDSCDATWDLKTGNQVWKAKWNGRETTLTSTYTKDDPATLDEVVRAYKQVRQQLDAISQMGTSTAVHKAYSNTSSDEVVQIYVTCQLKKNGGAYLQAVKDLVQKMVHLNSALMTCEDSKLETTKINATTYNKDKNGTIYLYRDGINQLESHMKKDGNDYINIFNTALTKSNGYVSSLSSLVSRKETSVNNSLSAAQKAASTFHKKITEKINNLTTAINNLSQARTMLSSTGSCTTAKNTWSSSAQGLGDDTMGKRDQDEIKDLEKLIDYDKVDKLITRLNAAKTALTTVASEIAKYSVCGKSFKDMAQNTTYANLVTYIKEYDTVTGSSEKFHDNIVGTVVTSNGAYDSIITRIKGTVKTGTVPTTWNQGQGPNLGPDFPALYSWMYNNYYDPNMQYDSTSTTSQTNSADDDLSKATGNIESAKAEGHKTASEVSGSSGTAVNRDMSPYLEAENGLPSTRWAGEKEELAKAEIKSSADEMMDNEANDNFLKTIMNMALDMGRDLRDNLYVSEYIMTMFSYATMEAEIWDQNNTDANYPKAGYFENVDGTWKAKGAYASYAAKMKTMTKVPIDPTMNYLYGEEIEYILYGDAGATGVYATIFALRFGLNTIYAFMDAEINNVTLSAATALFGTPPLTPLIPVAKIAMTVALALAESGWDLNELSKGKAIPLMKNKDTWIMSPTGIAKEVKDEAMTIAKDAADKVIDKGYEVLNNALTATSEELDAIIASGEEGIGQLTDAALKSATSSLENYANMALQKVVELCNQVNQEYMMAKPNEGGTTNFPGDVTEKANVVRTRLQQWMDSQTGDTEVVKEVKQIAVNYLSGSGQVEAILNAIETQATSGTATDYLNGKMKAISDEISIKIEDATTKAGTALRDMKDNMVTELKSAAAQGADQLKDALSNKLDDCFDKIPTSDGAPKGAANGVVSSLLSWRYSDYLRIFVVVGLFANEELMLLRISDLIERNMQHKNNAEVLITTTETVTQSRFFGLIKYQKEKQVTSISSDAYSLSKAYTYVKLNAHIQVKPLFMTLPFMAETVENQLTGTKWYEFTCTSMMGY